MYVSLSCFLLVDQENVIAITRLSVVVELEGQHNDSPRISKTTSSDWKMNPSCIFSHDRED